MIGHADLDTLLSDRDQINSELKAVIEAPTEQPWGVHIERVEIKNVALPDGMKRSMSRQAEAEWERRARVIVADGEFQASSKVAQAATVMENTPGAMQLRLLQTIGDIAIETNSTLVMPFPIEMLRFFEKGSESATVNGSRQAVGPEHYHQRRTRTHGRCLMRRCDARSYFQ